MMIQDMESGKINKVNTAQIANFDLEENVEKFAGNGVSSLSH